MPSSSRLTQGRISKTPIALTDVINGDQHHRKAKAQGGWQEGQPFCVDLCNDLFSPAPGSLGGVNCGELRGDGCNVGNCLQATACPVDAPGNVGCLEWCQDLVAEECFWDFFEPDDPTNQNCNVPRSQCIEEFCDVGNLFNRRVRRRNRRHL